MPVIAETDLHAVLATLEQERPEVCVIDSVQTLHSTDLSRRAGSVAQVREVAGEIMRVAKQRRIAVLLVGHVTKEGALAGPRVLEHLVDCVLQFEGERERTYRTVRAIKNRFGSTNEAGVFEMRDDGLVEVLDASARFVAEATRSPGSVVLCAMEGSRPLLVEVQALVSSSSSSRRGGSSPASIATGWRWSWRCSAATAGSGWATPTCSSTSSAACASMSRGPIWPSRWRWPARPSGSRSPGTSSRPLACFGELGLTGELRTVGHADRRLAEAERFGLAPVLAAGGAQDAARSALGRPGAAQGGGAGGVRRRSVAASGCMRARRKPCDTRASVRIPATIVARKGLKRPNLS